MYKYSMHLNTVIILKQYCLCSMDLRDFCGMDWTPSPWIQWKGR